MPQDLLSTLSDQLEGSVLTPGEAGYDEARTVWNAMIDRHPQMIVRCASVRDVVTAIRTARANGLEIGIRCGGHSVAGHAVPAGGLMIDLTPMGGVHIDAGRRVARIQGGALLGALDRASQEFDLATPSGNVSHTGVGGLTLGGGMGWLARQYGLACDNVLSCEVVCADGSVVRASETEHPDLYWGLRGGGGNFGVVTEFEVRLHSVGTQALTVELDFPLAEGETVLRRWRDLAVLAPRPATFAAAIGNGTVTIGYVWVGDIETGERLLPSVRDIGRPVAERVVPTTYVELQRRDDTMAGHAQRRYWQGHYFRELVDDAIRELLDVAGRGGITPNMSLQTYGGAIADVPDADTPFSHRDAMFELVAAARWTDPAEDAERIATTKRPRRRSADSRAAPT